jgi:iron only hydrogenase large subunit-like protein
VVVYQCGIRCGCKELAEIFKALEINVSTLPSDEKDQASFVGRLYARTGGVSLSVKSVVNRLEPTRLIKLKAKQVDGVKNLREALNSLKENKEEPHEFNFLEGMGCLGGCVGGPRTVIDMESGTRYANQFGEDSVIMTPFDNVNVMKILKQLGINSIEELITNERAKKLLIRE